MAYPGVLMTSSSQCSGMGLWQHNHSSKQGQGVGLSMPGKQLRESARSAGRAAVLKGDSQRQLWELMEETFHQELLG